MSLFSKPSNPAFAPEISGSEAIRARAWSRMRHGHLARTATDLQIPLAALDAFARGAGQLSVAQLEQLVKEFYMNTRFDSAQDKLIDISPPPKLAGIPSEPYDQKRDNPNYVAPDPNAPLRGPRLQVPEAPKPDPFKRPGFA